MVLQLDVDADPTAECRAASVLDGDKCRPCQRNPSIVGNPDVEHWFESAAVENGLHARPPLWPEYVHIAERQQLCSPQREAVAKLDDAHDAGSLSQTRAKSSVSVS